MSCRAALDGAGRRRGATGEKLDYAWTDLTYLLHRTTSAGATTSPTAASPTAPTTRCAAPRVAQRASTPEIWNPLPRFDTVQQDNQLEQHRSRSATSTRRRANGTLPAVSWVIPVAERQRTPARARQRRPDLRHRR